MARVLVFAAIAAVILTVFAVVDCALADRGSIRALPRWAWILVALVLPVIGPVLWLLLGRGSAKARLRPRYIGPDDDPAFLASHGGTRSRPVAPAGPPDDERWRAIEQELANLDPDADDDGDAGRR